MRRDFTFINFLGEEVSSRLYTINFFSNSSFWTLLSKTVGNAVHGKSSDFSIQNLDAINFDGPV